VAICEQAVTCPHNPSLLHTEDHKDMLRATLFHVASRLWQLYTGHVKQCGMLERVHAILQRLDGGALPLSLTLRYGISKANANAETAATACCAPEVVARLQAQTEALSALVSASSAPNSASSGDESLVQEQAREMAENQALLASVQQALAAMEARAAKKSSKKRARSKRGDGGEDTGEGDGGVGTGTGQLQLPQHSQSACGDQEELDAGDGAGSTTAGAGASASARSGKRDKGGPIKKQRVPNFRYRLGVDTAEEVSALATAAFSRGDLMNVVDVLRGVVMTHPNCGPMWNLLHYAQALGGNQCVNPAYRRLLVRIPRTTAIWPPVCSSQWCCVRRHV
jgi:hypothetical protein